MQEKEEKEKYRWINCIPAIKTTLNYTSSPNPLSLSLSLSPLKKNVAFQVWKRQEFWNLLSYKKSSNRKKKSFVIVGFSKSTWENPKQKQNPKKKKKKKLTALLGLFIYRTLREFSWREIKNERYG